MKSILLLGQSSDPHIVGISDELKKLKEQHVILDNFSAEDTFFVSLENSKSDFELKIQDFKLKQDNIKSVWNTSALRINLEKELIKEARKFILAEWTEGIKSLWDSVDAKWVNSPKSITNSSNRLEQLKIANKLGLQTPKSLITNDFQKLAKFYGSCDGEIIAKTLGSSKGLPEEKMIFTTKISKKELEKSEDLKYAPCMFQEYIPKKTEFRITIIGEKIHTAEIESQRSAKTKDDWRNYDDFEKTPYHKSALPKDIETKLFEMMKELGLGFGAFDMIRTPNDDFVFLEVNANGRWWWIQELTKMNIAKDIAYSLADSKNS